MENVLWHARFAIKQGGICSHKKMARLGGPVRPVPKTSHTGMVKLLKKKNGLHCCVYLVETIEMHIFNVQFGLRMREIWLRKVLHPDRLVKLVYRGGQTGPDSPN